MSEIHRANSLGEEAEQKIIAVILSDRGLPGRLKAKFHLTQENQFRRRYLFVRYLIYRK